VTNSELRKEYFDRLLDVGRSIHKKRLLNEFKFEILKSENGASKLYKYCNIETAEKILSNGTLLLQGPEYFNDPFDCLANVAVWDGGTRFGPSATEIRDIEQVLLNLPSKYRPSEFELSHDLRVAYKFAITCFSTDFKNHLLWSHYANHHMGVCIQFDLTDMAHDIHPCLYTNDLGMFDWKKGDKSLAVVKNAAWEYEQEWRFVRKTIRPKMRLLSQVLSTIYDSVHANPEFGVAEHEEWSSINAQIVKSMEVELNHEKFLRIKPTKIILGAKFAKHQVNTNRRAVCESIVTVATECRIPLSLMTASKSTFELQEVDINKREFTWLDLDPALKASLPASMEDDTGVLCRAK
jgi:Protein of unknown function (DUF2971)